MSMNINISEYIIFISGILNLLIALFVLVKKPKSLVHISFFVAILGITVWSSGFASLALVKDFMMFTRITLFGGVIWVLGLLAFTRFFPDHHSISFKKKHINFLILPTIVSVLIFLDYIIVDIDFSSDVVHPINGPLFPVLALYVVGYLIISLFFIIKTFRSSLATKRNQIGYFFLGFSLFILITIIFDVILPGIGITHLNSLGPLSSLLLVGTTAYAIVRHQLMDVRVVIQRGLIYLFLFGVVSLGYVGLLSVLSKHLHVLTSEDASYFSGAIITIIGILTVPVIDRYLRKITDKVFFKDRYEYARAIHNLSKTVHETFDLQDLLNQTTRELERIFRSSLCRYILSPIEQISPLQDEVFSFDNEITLYVPVVFKKSLVATLVMDSKKSGDRYTKEDIQLLETFSYQIAVALEKARLFKQVQDYSRDLEHKVEERTHAIKTLQQEQEHVMLDISHNLQTPLTVLKSELSLLKDDERILNKERIFAFEKTIDRVANFTDKLLNIARRGMIQNHDITVFNLSSYLEEIAEYVNIITENQGVASEFTIAPHVCIKGNKKDIEELVINLFSNATKYVHKRRKPKIYLDLSTDNNKALLKIKDNGRGIKKEELDKIFERFYRVEHNSECSGTGLGLAICKKIVESHHGQIEITSEYGKWTECVVSFPLVTCPREI